MIGPISGEINIAPIITAVEFVFKPSEATKVAKNPKVRPFKLYAFPDRLDRFEFILFFLTDIEITDKEVPNLLVQQSFFHPIKINVCIRTSRKTAFIMANTLSQPF